MGLFKPGKDGKPSFLDQLETVSDAISEVDSVFQKKVRCPKCRSTNISALGQHRKKFSVGKAAAGTMLTGGVGALAGFAGKKTKKVDMICMDCGKQFQYKK
ncbi:LITAF-like zinc ribbon domain-containing protein [Lactobacillus sp. ESL0681]|uniref:LITAF-like zinc ribbon domain-containing protein n=1 Tax=Lactobacillus sp. ESL0681 TaxID=2983211 RepID=UPI0023F9D9F8|nr:LITAF-like zinc ribbon domain-containing protein [Lactobacillus sp. ESL0681]WEV40312.1 LITAF-like zinc ribbon domain-containing protein [Lactobacillus sp. ESL0681]